jgi:dTDP-4-amino-4,6-dideoxygalactose transaminase
MASRPPLRIPFNRPTLRGRENEYMARAVASGHVSGDGQFTKACEEILAAEAGSARAFLTTSCTDALEMSALLLDLREGDEVISPAFTFVSTANAFALRGARPVFADIRADTLNIDERHLEGLLTPRTRAIVVVHYAGVGCEMEPILALARERRLPVIEDNAHGLFGRHRGKPLGSFGGTTTLSFHETKNVTCGEGGALLVNDPALTERAEILREKGTNRSRFFRGQVDKYSWVDLGSSFLPSDLLAAFLLAQLEDRAAIQNRRRELWDRYNTELAGWAARHGVGLPVVPTHCEQAYHMFYMVMPSLEARQRLIAHLAAGGIGAVFHYLPLNRSDMARRLGSETPCPVTEDVSDRLVRLPFFTALTADEQGEVLRAVMSAALS